jgi:hypothetical protein
MDEGCEVCFKDQIDIGSSNDSLIKTISLMCNKEWTTYVRIMIKSEIRGIELIARMIAQNDISNKSSQSPDFS